MAFSLRADIERIRVAAERDAFALLERQEAVVMRRPYVPQETAAVRRGLLAGSLFLADTMAPEAYDAAREATRALGVDDRVELFQSSDVRFDSARLALYGQPIAVEFIGSYLDGLDRGALLAVIGHEIGHAIAHSAHPTFARAQGVRSQANTPTRRAYSIAAELTADRCGLIACRDLDAALRLEMHSAAGNAPKSIRFDTQAYLEQCRSLAEETLAAGGLAMGHTHPEHYIRGYAEWLFSETDVYREITGVGSGARSLEEVDAILQRLIGMPQPSGASTSIAKPQPRVSPAASATTATVGAVRVDEAVVTAPVQSDTLTAEILIETARVQLATAHETISTFVNASVPSFRRLAEAARDRLSGPERRPPSTATDALEDERGDLEARFLELERRFKDK
jgi:hypothetical protein